MQRPVRTPEGRILERERATIVDDGACIGSVWHFRDVTALRRQEAELVLAKESAERAARAKADFLANMSHELRTPLNAILGFARILLRGSHGPLEPRRRSFVENIEHAGEHMLKLVNDLLALRRLEEKEPELVERVELTRVTATALELLGPSLEEKSISFALSVDDDASAVRADPQLLLHALVNLLSNAAKFTPNGGHVHVHSHRARAEVAIDVIDDGIGIAEADQPRLFTYFEQLGAKHALGMHGSGIGLALTRKLVESMHGRITVRSAPGQGTRFRITLPAPADARAVEPRGLA
jgi:signal transduction histidine kinase